MADEITEGTPTEGTETGKYLTKKYLITNLQSFWKSIKKYITDQKFVDQSYVSGAINNAVSGKADQTALEALTTEVQGKANSSALETLNQTVNSKIGKSDLDNALEGKVDKVEGKGLSTNDFTTDEKNKLTGIDKNANNYSHPTDSGNRHIPSGGQEGQILRWSSDGTAMWGNDSNTTYSEATENAAGLMSADDKKKLDDLVKDYKDANNNLITAHKLDETDDIELKISNVKHSKIHFYSNGELKCIENFSVVIKGITFGNNEDIIIQSPDKEDLGSTSLYNFYVECLELDNGDKYKPFVLSLTENVTGLGHISLDVDVLTP